MCSANCHQAATSQYAATEGHILREDLSFRNYS